MLNTKVKIFKVSQISYVLVVPYATNYNWLDKRVFVYSNINSSKPRVNHDDGCVSPFFLSSASFEIQLMLGPYSVRGAPTARRTRPTAVTSSPLDRLPLPSSSPPANGDPFRDDPPQARLIASPFKIPYFSNFNPHDFGASLCLKVLCNGWRTCRNGQ